MIQTKVAALVLFAHMAAIGVLQSRGAAYVPKPGSAERKAIMDALRPPVERELHRAVIFKVDHLKLQNGWAFIRGVPKQPDGRPINYKDTKYEAARREGMFDDWICALLRRKGTKWTVVEFVIGATDVPYEGWDREHGAPSSIFK
jgi:hypothetical protein